MSRMTGRGPLRDTGLIAVFVLSAASPVASIVVSIGLQGAVVALIALLAAALGGTVGMLALARRRAVAAYRGHRGRVELYSYALADALDDAPDGRVRSTLESLAESVA